MEQKLFSCAELLKRISDIFQTRANKDLEEHGVTVSQMKMMGCLDQAENKSLPLKEIEKYFGVSQATIAGIAARLEKKGFIKGYIDSEDRRIKHVCLTEKGSNLCNHAKNALDQGERILLEPLEEAEQVEFQQLLQKVYNNLR